MYPESNTLPKQPYPDRSASPAQQVLVLVDFSKINRDELLMADIEAFNGFYENLIKILDKAISVK
jgi:hypothetical protein